MPGLMKPTEVGGLLVTSSTAHQPTWVAGSGPSVSYLGIACESGTRPWSQLRQDVVSQG